MTIALSSAVIVLGVLVFLLLGSQVEMFRNIEQLREYGGLLDRPSPIKLSAGNMRPSALALPDRLDSAAAAVVLFLSDKCATCRAIAATLQYGIPDDLLVIVDPGPEGEFTNDFTHQLDKDRTIVDSTGAISGRIGLRITPSAVVIENGRITRATTLPSTRQLFTLLESIRATEPAAVSYTPEKAAMGVERV